MKTLWKTRTSDVIWEMILEANNAAHVQNARPLAEGIVAALRNIPRRGSNVVIVPPPYSVSPTHTEPTAVFSTPYTDRQSCETTTVKNDQTPRQCLRTHISETTTSISCKTFIEQTKGSKIIGTQIIGSRRTLHSPHSLFHQCCEKCTSGTATSANPQFFFQILVFRLSSAHHNWEDKWLSSPASFAPFSGPPILGHCRVRTLSSSMPTTRNQNQTRYTTSAHLQCPVYLPDHCVFLFTWNSFSFVDDIVHFDAIVCVDQCSNHITRDFTRHQEQNTRSAKTIHIARLAPPQTLPISVWYHGRDQRNNHIISRKIPSSWMITNRQLSSSKTIHITR